MTLSLIKLCVGMSGVLCRESGFDVGLHLFSLFLRTKGMEDCLDEDNVMGASPGDVSGSDFLSRPARGDAGDSILFTRR